MRTLSTHKKIIIGASSGLAGVVLALAFGVVAEDTELDSDPRVFPYKGVLEFNGEAMTGQADFLFTLTDDDGCDFTEAHENVDVFGGQFAVNIGAVQGDVPDCVFDAERVFLSIAVRAADDEGAHTALSGRQRINPVPFAYWAAEGSDIRIDGDANIGNDANIGGNATVGNDVNIGGDIEFTGASNIRFSNQGVDTNADVGSFDDYKLLLHRGSTPQTSYGLGIQSDTLFLNSNDVIDFKVDAVDKLVLASDVTAFKTTVRFDSTDISFGNNAGRGDGGRIMVHGASDTLLLNHNGDFAGGTRLTGNLDLRGGLSRGDGDLTINDNLNVTGAMEVTGALTTSELNGLDNINPGGREVVTGGDVTVGGKVKATDGLGESSCAWRGATQYIVRSNERAGGTLASNDNDDKFHTLVCPVGQYMAGWQCRASDRLDDSCRAYCCRP